MRLMTAKLELNRDEVDLLAWNIANEVVNAFAVEDFTTTIGTPLEVFKQIASRLRSVDCENAVITLTEAAAFRNALALTLKELGEDEFHTRTGHSFEGGNLILARLNRSLEDQ